MPIYKIPLPTAKRPFQSWDLGEKDLAGLEEIRDYPTLVQELRTGSKILRDLSVKDLLHFFDSLSARWLSDQNPFLKKYSPLGVSFLISFLRRSNLEPLLRESLRGNICYLDTFQESPSLGQNMMAHPRGVLTHWLVGNVPVLGMISLVQGILSKNANVVKVPRKNGLVLPSMAAEMADHSVQTEGGSTLTGEALLKTVLFVYCDKTDLVSQQLLSKTSDVRVAWGGREAVESVMSLPKSYGTEDVIFGPKYSFAVIARNAFKKEDLAEVADKLALDASVFDQYGCNSPHTVFVEKGGKTDPLEVAKALAGGMEKALRRIPKGEVSAEEAYSVVKIRSEYEVSGQVFASKGTEWTVIYSGEKGLAAPSFSRVVFVRPIEDIQEVVTLINRTHQTLGLVIDPKRKINFAKEATAKGIERVTELGRMSAFGYPWDGMFPIDRFVRWVSLP